MAMGRLLLQHIQNAAPVPENEDLPIKNTFIHFRPAAPRPLNRSRTEPWSQVRRAKSCEPKEAPEDEAFPDTNDEMTEVEDDYTTSTSDADEEDDVQTSKESAFDDSANEPGSEHGASARDATTKGSPPWSDISDEEEQQEPAVEPIMKEDPVEDQATPWHIDGRKLKGRDTRVSTVLRLLVGGGPANIELVATIFPLPVSSKRGGACFKASNSIGRIQLKCNTPLDEELFVSVSSGQSTQVQKHNFMTNPLMTFNGNWDFKPLIDAEADRPIVTLSLRLGFAEDGADLPPGVAMMDPAISAFSISSSAHVALEPPKFDSHHGDSENATLPGLRLSSLPHAVSPQSTPDVSPRCLSPQTCTSSPCTQNSQVPPSSPFSLGGSVLFNFTLRRADGFDVGLDVSRDEANEELVVERVIPGGAVESWNRQCFTGTCASKALVPSDRIVCVNSRTDIPGMLDECRERQLLKIYVVRGDLRHHEIPYGWCGAPSVPAPVQFIPIPVPICFPVAVPCAKHGFAEVGYDGTYIASPDQLVDPEASNHEAPHMTLRANAPEFSPSMPEQVVEDDDLGTKTDDDA